MTVPEDLTDWLVLLQVPGLGPAGARSLAEGLGGPAAVRAADGGQLARTGMSLESRRALRSPDWSSVEATLRWLEPTGHGALTLSAQHYPALLRAIPDAPPVLFVRGDPQRLSAAQIAVVGSRNPTRQGAETARDFAATLAREGLGVTSGLAVGIDAAAHLGALEAGGLTVAVAGHGLDTVYPRRHRDLAERIAAHGALVSEFPPGVAPRREHFPRRNRIISGLALGVLVVEAAARSGSLITARLGGEQGREVFAIPGSIHNPMARGCHRLIRQGAKLVESVADMLEEIGWAARGEIGRHGEGAHRHGEEAPVPGTPDALDEDYVTLLDALGHDPATVDVLVERTGLTPQALSSMLLRLELQGIVHPQPGSGYVRAAKRE